MCTVVFIPGGDRCFFASLRDESPTRPRSSKPGIRKVSGTEILSPVDAMAGGSWLGVNENGHTIVLLNGGFSNHERRGSYRKSRGLIVTELLSKSSPVASWNLMAMDNIEPYTLVVFESGNLFQLVWDGEEKHATQLNKNLPYIWSSTTLYDHRARKQRGELFQQWIATNTPVSGQQLLCFFTSFKDGVNGFLINRDEQIRTLSFTFIELKINEWATMQYIDLLEHEDYHSNISFQKSGEKHLHPGSMLQNKMVDNTGCLK